METTPEVMLVPEEYSTIMEAYLAIPILNNKDIDISISPSYSNQEHLFLENIFSSGIRNDYEGGTGRVVIKGRGGNTVILGSLYCSGVYGVNAITIENINFTTVTINQSGDIRADENPVIGLFGCNGVSFYNIGITSNISNSTGILAYNSHIKGSKIKVDGENISELFYAKNAGRIAIEDEGAEGNVEGVCYTVAGGGNIVTSKVENLSCKYSGKSNNRIHNGGLIQHMDSGIVYGIEKVLTLDIEHNSGDEPSFEILSIQNITELNSDYSMINLSFIENTSPKNPNFISFNSNISGVLTTVAKVLADGSAIFNRMAVERLVLGSGIYGSNYIVMDSGIEYHNQGARFIDDVLIKFSKTAQTLKLLVENSGTNGSADIVSKIASDGDEAKIGLTVTSTEDYRLGVKAEEPENIILTNSYELNSEQNYIWSANVSNSSQKILTIYGGIKLEPISDMSCTQLDHAGRVYFDYEEYSFKGCNGTTLLDFNMS